MTGNALLDLLLIAIPILAIRLWWTGSRAHELAVQHAQRACRQQQLQFLDQTVALSAMRMGRNATGATSLVRKYRFEYTSEGAHRDTASVTMHGHQLKRIEFPYVRDADGNRIYVH